MKHITNRILSTLLILALSFVAFPAFADDDLDCQVIAETVNPTEAQATPDYINLTDGTIGTTAAAEDEFTVPVDVIAWGLRVDVDVAPGGTDEWNVFVVDDGTATGVTCTILGTATSCSSAQFTGVATIAAGSDLTVLIDSAAGATDPAAAAEARVSFCLARK